MDQGSYAETTTDPKGNVTKKIFDKAGRIYQVYDNVNSTPTTYTYYDNGNKQSVVYPTGAKEEYTYNGDNTLNTLVNTKSDRTALESYSYTYDNNKNMLSKSDPKGTTSYTYDVVGRLETLSEPNGNFTKYEYDGAGNRATETLTQNGNTTVTSYTYNDQNRLTDTSTTVNNVTSKTSHLAYDNNGNETSETKQTYINAVIAKTEVTTNVYDKLNQLIQTTTPDGKTVKNTYNGDGLRTAKDSDGDKTQYLYDGDKVILETDASGNQKARDVQGTNLISRTTSDSNGAAYYMYNGHADVTKVVGSDNNVDNSYYYDAYGNLTEDQDTIKNPFRYAGYEYDEETKTYYLKARMYDPEEGRFLQEDTYRGDINDPLSLNYYTYCEDNPIRYDDPTGHHIATDEDDHNLKQDNVVEFNLSDSVEQMSKVGKVNYAKKTEKKPYKAPSVASIGNLKLSDSGSIIEQANAYMSCLDNNYTYLTFKNNNKQQFADDYFTNWTYEGQVYGFLSGGADLINCVTQPDYNDVPGHPAKGIIPKLVVNPKTPISQYSKCRFDAGELGGNIAFQETLGIVSDGIIDWGTAADSVKVGESTLDITKGSGKGISESTLKWLNNGEKTILYIMALRTGKLSIQA